MNQELVSVIMPAYNASKYIKDSIQSVIAQHYANWELLVIDDGSTDSTVQIVEDMAKSDNRIRLFINHTPSGSPAIPRNIGIQNAQGRYIAFLDSDDLWIPEKLAEQIPLFQGEDTKIVFSFYRKLLTDGKISDGIVSSPSSVSYHQLLKGNVIGNLTGIYDTAKVGKPLFKKLGHEDYIYWLNILRSGGYAVNTQKVHALYRLSENSVSANKLKVFKWDWYIFRHVEGLSWPYASWCFICYAIKGVLKTLIK